METGIIAKDQHYVYELDMVPGKTNELKKWTTFNLATTATTTSTLGTGLSSTYDTVAIKWLEKVVESAKKTFYYEQICQQETIPEGADTVAIPKQPIFDNQAYESTGEEIAASAEVVWTSIDPCTVAEVVATDKIYGATISNKLLRTCNIPYLNYVKDKLVYQQFSILDTTVRDALVGKHGASTSNTATPMSDSVAGLQTIFGAGATNADDALNAGAVLTPALIKKAKRLLESDAGYYWSTNTWTKSSVKKNPWKNENDFVLFVAPEQIEALLNDSQFTNAAEFGSDKAVLNGEIARYLGIKIVVTPNVPSFGTNHIRCQNADVNTDVNGHVCTLMKAGKAGAIGWSQKPKFHVFPYPSALQTRMVLEMSFGVKELYADAMVNIVVSDE